MAQVTSSLWKELLTLNGTIREYAFDINGDWYGPDEDAEISHSVNGELYSEFGIGNATSAKLSLVIWADDIPRSSTIKRYVRLRYEDRVSEWVPSGVFYSNKRISDDNRWSIEAFDGIRKADVVWDPDVSFNFPLPMTDAVAEFCRIMGVELDPRTSIGENYFIDYPSSGTTIRNELSWIAAAHGGNFIMTSTGKLRLVPLNYTGEKNNVGFDVVSFEDAGKRKPITRVTLYIDSTNSFTAGDDTGREISATCPTATAEMAEAVLAKVKGVEYHAYSATSAALDPAAELGDSITVCGIDSIVASVSDDGNGFPDVSAPGEAEIEEDDPYVSPMQQEINRQNAQTRAIFEKTTDSIRAEVSNISGDIARLQITASEIEAAVSNQAGDIAQLQIDASGLESRVEDAEGDISVLQQDSGKVRVSITDQSGTLETTIDADSWEALRRNLSGEITSGFYYDFELGRFVYDGTGVFRSGDGKTYIEIDGNELILYSSRGVDGAAVDKLRIGFIRGQNPSGTAEVDYPYILLGNAGNTTNSGLVKKFWNGLFVGNSAAKEASGNFEVQDNYAGFFVNILTGKSYVIQDGEMKDVYTGSAIAKFR